MRRFSLFRIAQIISDGTFGVLRDEGIPFCLTLERLWLNNRKSESCIPEGLYICKRLQSPKFGNTFEVTQVPDRTAILIHKGNIIEDSHGCIILGEQFEPLNGHNAVLSSGKAFDEFLQRTRDLNEFELIIQNKWD